MNAYNVRITAGPSHSDDGLKLRDALRKVLWSLDGITVDYRGDTGLVIRSTFTTDSAGGALAAAGGVAELVAQSLDRLTPKAREAWASILRNADVKARLVR